MKDELFLELVKSIKQGGAILRGEAPQSRSFEYLELEIKLVRKRFNLSQDKFAALVGISVKTLRNWEQGRRKPEGPARVLLQVAASHPQVLLEIAAQYKTLNRAAKPPRKTIRGPIRKSVKN